MHDSSLAVAVVEPTCEGREGGEPLDHAPSREPIGFHVTIRLEDDRPIAPTIASLRALARIVLAQGERRGLLAFGAADNHLHAEVITDRASAGAFARYVETSLTWSLGLGARFERARIRPLHDQRHAYNTFHYAHRQAPHHGLDLERLTEGTSLPDLLGLRVLPTSIATRVRTHLPRIRREHLLALVPPTIFAHSQPFDLDVLADAAAAAFALRDLHGRADAAPAARRAAVHAAGSAFQSKDLSIHLGIGIRAIQSFRNQPADPTLVHAIQRQARLRTQLKKPPENVRQALRFQ